MGTMEITIDTEIIQQLGLDPFQLIFVSFSISRLWAQSLKEGSSCDTPRKIRAERFKTTILEVRRGRPHQRQPRPVVHCLFDVPPDSSLLL